MARLSKGEGHNMVDERKVRRLKRTVTICLAALFTAWFVVKFSFLTNSQNGGIRFPLAVLFSLLILLRPKYGPQEDEALLGHEPMPMSWAVAGAAGVFLVLAGLILRLHQAEWLGLLVLIYASLRWIMPPRASKDILLSLLLLYWAHPLPAQVFAPLQFVMQRISVNVSEWFMHIINVRVWADDMVLRTGSHVYEIPIACSGMRTATTVLLLSVGLGVLHRFRLLEVMLLAVVSLLQAVMLNVFRITMMVTLAPKTGAGAGPRFLHDTAGTIVVAAVLIVYVEIYLFKRARRVQEEENADLSGGIIKGLYGLPSFWNRLVSHKFTVISLVLAAIFSLGLAYKSRPWHRAGMYMDVVEGLRDAGQAGNAARLARRVVGLVPGDVNWQLEALRVMILNSEYQDVLEEIKKLPELEQEIRMESDVLEAYALTGLGRYGEAEKVLERLPAELEQPDPRLAMVFAEMGMYAGNPGLIRSHIVTAAEWPANIRRIRNLYPYMRTHRMWKEISLSDMNIDYENIIQALSAAEAFMNLNDVPAVARIVLQCASRWPLDVRLLTPMYFLALGSFAGEWEKMFSETLSGFVKQCGDPDELSVFLPMCFQLRRPDLAWMVFDRISEIDPGHPSLWMCAARYGHKWFRFRRHWLGFSSEEMDAEIDIKPLFLAGLSTVTRDVTLERVALWRDLYTGNTAPVQAGYLDRALGEFKKRDTSGTMSGEMRREYIRALGMKGDVSAAAAQLGRIDPQDAETVLLGRIVLSEVYESRNAWPDVYGLLKNYHREKDPKLEPLLRLFRAQMRLKLGIMALNTAGLAVELFPDVPEAVAAMAEISLELDMPEEALFVLGGERPWRDRRLEKLEAEALWRTERYHLAETAARSALLPSPPVPESLKQKQALPGAELSTMWHLLHVPSEADFAAVAEAMRKNLHSAAGGFIEKMNSLWLECYDQKCGGNSALMTRWLACGETMEEKATALSQLVLHLCRANRIEEARNVAGAAVRFMPASPVLWQMLISLSNADGNVVSAARRFCPGDSTIWLADVVVSKDADTGIASEFTPAALTRAAEFLFRAGSKQKAAELMRCATQEARGLLPAYIMGARCAIFAQDREWAAKCIRLAVEASVEPGIDLYRKLVQIKTDGEKIDTDTEMMEALNNLREEDPENPLWAEMLGCVRYSRGGGSILEAMYQMELAIKQGSASRNAYLVAAESARQIGNYEKAVEFLKEAMKLYKNDITVLNNLVYTLASAPGREQELSEYLPEFEKSAGDSPAMLDTLVSACVVTRQYDKAEKVIESILEKVPESGASWFRAKMHQAEIALHNDMPNRAGIILRQILNNSKGVSNEDVLQANRLLEECE